MIGRAPHQHLAGIRRSAAALADTARPRGSAAVDCLATSASVAGSRLPGCDRASMRRSSTSHSDICRGLMFGGDCCSVARLPLVSGLLLLKCSAAFSASLYRVVASFRALFCQKPRKHFHLLAPGSGSRRRSRRRC